jgi:hypothetical protein
LIIVDTGGKLPLVSTTPAVPVAKYATGVVDKTGSKKSCDTVPLTQQVLRKFFSNFGLIFQYVSPLDPWI